MLSVKQVGTKYHFLSFWYDSTWDGTQVSRDTLTIMPMSGNNVTDLKKFHIGQNLQNWIIKKIILRQHFVEKKNIDEQRRMWGRWIENPWFTLRNQLGSHLLPLSSCRGWVWVSSCLYFTGITFRFSSTTNITQILQVRKQMEYDNNEH